MSMMAGVPSLGGPSEKVKPNETVEAKEETDEKVDKQVSRLHGAPAGPLTVIRLVDGSHLISALLASAEAVQNPPRRHRQSLPRG
jgi:hypothetical protein